LVARMCGTLQSTNASEFAWTILLQKSKQTWKPVTFHSAWLVTPEPWTPARGTRYAGCERLRTDSSFGSMWMEVTARSRFWQIRRKDYSRAWRRRIPSHWILTNGFICRWTLAV